MSDRTSKTLLSTATVGDFDKHTDEHVIRLWGDKHEHGITWIDFEVYEVIGVDPKTAKRIFQEKGATSNWSGTESLDKAESVAEGFVKWDGCTQFTMDVHVDSKDALEVVFKAVCEARRLAADVMSDKMIRDEYK